MFDAPMEAAAGVIEAAAALLLVWGTATTFVSIAASVARGRVGDGALRAAWLGLARWLVVSLEFQLAADVLHTAVAPSWAEIGRVAAIAVIRTFLSRALDADLEKAERQRAETAGPGRVPAATG